MLDEVCAFTALISAEIMRILKEPEVLDKLKGLAFVPAKESRQEFEAYIDTQVPKWAAVIKSIAAHTH